MRRVLSLVLISIFVASLTPLTAGASIASQSEEGSVLLPGPGPNGETTGGCWTGWARRFWIFSGGATAGPMGSMFEIDKKTWNGKFKLEVTAGAAGTEDLDVTFYSDPGHIDPADPGQQAGIVESGAYLTREAGGETGTVPPTSQLALVCLATGSGFNADWSYTGAPPAKAKK
ncbi:MAG: hypothetical protein QOH26_2292 [Actinomycetota bacterium]|jgi:hypothetical protein|nr:hypothetical protein [Actinomycetota bacterium]